MKDVAKLAGVSTATVSYVINSNHPVKQETREKVESAIEKLGYQVNPTARRLRNGKSRQILFLVSNLKNYFFMGIADGINNVLEAEGYSLVFMDSNEDPEQEEKNFKFAVLEDYAGFIIAPVAGNWNNLKKILGDKPAVFIDRHPTSVDRDFILNKNFEGGFELTELLIKDGHTKIGFFSDRFDSTMNERVDGYEAALQQYGIPVDKNLEVFGSERPRIYEKLSPRTGWNHLLEKAILSTKITAIVAGNSFFAFFAMDFFNASDIRIPQDMALAMFDDPFWLTPKRSAIISKPQNVHLIGLTAAEVLLRRINGSSSPYKEYRIDMLPLLRNS